MSEFDCGWVQDETDLNDIDVYQLLAARTINKEMSQKDMLLHSALGLASEAGELTGIYQKTYQGHDLAQQHEHIIKELGDCLWMIAEHCTALGIQLSQVAQTNIDKLKKRYPDGFDPDKSVHRAEGDI